MKEKGRRNREGKLRRKWNEKRTGDIMKSYVWKAPMEEGTGRRRRRK